MNLNVIHHVAIIVSDYQKAKAFYVDRLGFPVIRESYRPERGDWKLDLRLNETTELENLGIPCEPVRVDAFTGKAMTFFHDPDGLPLELHE